MADEKYWKNCAKKNLVGKRVVTVRYMSEKEAEEMMWDSRPLVIQFDDGTIIFPSTDDEGNDGGALFGQLPEGEQLTFPVL